MKMKETRPDIPKLLITNIGIVDSDGIAKYWAFDGKNNPKSVGEYRSLNWHLIGGYTVDELRAIAEANIV
jgi:hypothetical protein